jgi:hypothetical protein
MAQIEGASAVLQARTNIAQDVKERGERLRKIARYKNASDTVPMSDSIMLMDNGAPGDAKLPNVLSEDTWDLFRVLLR